ncbi:hypothetical protein ASPWEDRAFT_474326 [Aspergillus wentii DTO 134E9]|uniref:Zn(2)-C6 fungal-type domain-containing protein n=1 Tax=Aspergillus wentii DTO 134E9 TaxID=1073089 RepID=A0A1L9RIC5_ASPWE|nr:uncharacterized protein ASPWEDRAFT_474326 [Aspergillus wentii DTO 134E9]OJJ34682.1 hypothetical protein ASPWEDRAFT_474326 [Aspergillus wentii DTO 134E9]
MTPRNSPLTRTPRKEPPKAACQTCRKKKVKCSGTRPCQYCSKRGLDCEIPEQGQRRVYSISRIRDLRNRLAQYENSSSTGIPHDTTAAVDESNANPVTSTQTADTELSPSSTIHADSSLSSSYIFSSRVQSLLENPTPQRQTTANHCCSKNDNIPSLPTEEQAHRLLEVVIFFIGETQHHFDLRDFSDRLCAFYGNPSDKKTPWFLQMLLVLAIGKLFAGDFDDRDELPGSKLFEYAHQNLPTLGELYALDVLGVEILALVAVYLQNLNRKDEAYIYISTSLRLAISHSYNRTSGIRGFVQSKRVHLNRLWWTIYMQERRLAAATGNPFSIGDEGIDLDLPSDCLGYSTTAPLRTNIKISRVLGRIITVIYGPHPHTEDAFIPSVREIVQSIFDISQEIPSESTTSYPGLTPESSIRTSAYLQLMLYQATIVTIRPIMLHVAKQILHGETMDKDTLNTSPLGRLSRTCSEAARRLLEVLITLRKRDMLTIFGFFDFDAAFSAAFIMILTSIFDSVCEDGRRATSGPGLNDALDTLQYLGDRGNHFSKQGYHEVQQIWSHLSEYLQARQSTPEHQPVGDADVHSASADYIEQTESNTETSVDNTLLTGNALSDMPMDTNLWDDFSHLWQGIDTTNVSHIAGADAQNYFYPLYSNLDMDLTGEDMEDFNEFRKRVLNI